MTFPISASGSGGIETAVINVLEPGDEAIVCVNGVFSGRMAEVAERTGVKVHRVTAPFGRTVDPQDVRRAGQGSKIKFVGLAHGETSTGVVTKIDPFRQVADELGALLIVDSVATLAGVPLDVDRQRIDVCFSGTQKAISAPPGMAPITVNSRVEELLGNRKTKVQSWYFDLTTVKNYWGKERTYHHTPPIPLIYALYEAMRIVLEEGLEASWERHRQNQSALIAGLEAMGIGLFVQNPADRLPTVTAVMIPSGIDGAKGEGPVAQRFQYRNRRRAGRFQDHDVAHRLDGLFEPARERASVSRCAGKNPARPGHEVARRRGDRRGGQQFYARRTCGRGPRKVADEHDDFDWNSESGRDERLRRGI